MLSSQQFILKYTESKMACVQWDFTNLHENIRSIWDSQLHSQSKQRFFHCLLHSGRETSFRLWQLSAAYVGEGGDEKPTSPREGARGLLTEPLLRTSTVWTHAFSLSLCQTRLPRAEYLWSTERVTIFLELHILNLNIDINPLFRNINSEFTEALPHGHLIPSLG